MDTSDRSFNSPSRFRSEWAGDIGLPTNVEWVESSDDEPCIAVIKNQPRIPAIFWIAGKIANSGNHLTVLGDWTPASPHPWTSAQWVLRLVEPDEPCLAEEFRSAIRVMDILQSQVMQLCDAGYMITSFSNTVASPYATLRAPLYRHNPARLQDLQTMHGPDASHLTWTHFVHTNDIRPLNVITDRTWTIQPPQYATLLPDMLVEIHFSVSFLPDEHPQLLTCVEALYVL